jgi:hypothetical protein
MLPSSILTLKKPPAARKEETTAGARVAGPMAENAVQTGRSCTAWGDQLAAGRLLPSRSISSR